MSPSPKALVQEKTVISDNTPSPREVTTVETTTILAQLSLVDCQQ